MELDAALKTYITESRELLEEMEDTLLSLEQEEEPDDSLNAIFRAAHTIKGSAGLFGLDHVVAFTHGVESLLDKLRSDQLIVDGDITELLLSCKDHISNLIDSVESEENEADPALVAKGQELGERLKKYDATTGNSTDVAVMPNKVVAGESVNRAGVEYAGGHNWHISLRFGKDSFRDGMDPISFIRYLNAKGEIVHIKVLDDAIPMLEEFEPESCYMGFEISYKSSADKQTIEDAFEFIREDSEIRIIPPRSMMVDYLKLIEDLPEEDMRLGEILVQCGTLTEHELTESLRIQEKMRSESVEQTIGDIVVENGMADKPVVEAAVEKQSKVREKTGRESQSIRVDSEKLDNLINLIGELVISSAGTSLNAQSSADAVLIESVSSLTRLVEEVRDSALRLRMVQIGATFNRFKRVVHDMSNELGKDIQLEISGNETELDKTVVEKIGDPLMHLVRNAIDHGIEQSDLRLSMGKPAAGKLSLNAYHDSGSIVIEVSDDGAGLDKDKILAKAMENGLLQNDQQIDEEEIYNLIFEPGFSTAGEVTNLSGRGVGMDVVKRNINSLRGTVEVESQLGKGSTFRVRMPLTLAIIDGFLVGVNESAFVVPLEMVLECVELNEVNREGNNGRNYMSLRGEVLPFIRLREIFEVDGTPPRRENVVVVNAGGKKAGLVVDDLMGEFQTVIKPLGRIFSHVSGVGGSTILGDGNVALIIDVPGLLKQVTDSEKTDAGIPA